MELQKTVQSYSGQKVQVNAIPITEALAEFVDWLISLQGEIVLLGHNAKIFDAPHFVRTVIRYEMQEQFSMLTCFAGSLPLFRKNYPELKDKYKLASLHSHFIGTAFAAHNASRGCQCLS